MSSKIMKIALTAIIIANLAGSRGEIVAQDLSFDATASIGYFLHMEKPNSHYFDVSITVSAIDTAYLDFVMPSWAPGRYMILDFVRHVTSVRALNAKGEPVRYERIDKNTFRVYPEEGEVVFSYSVYSNYLSATFSKLSRNGAVVNGASLFMYVKYKETVPCMLSVFLPSGLGWSLVSTLPSREQAWTFRADSYRHLIDSPLFAGEFSRHAFECASTPFHVIFNEGPEAGDRKELVAKIKRICEAARVLFDEFPFRSYYFFFDFRPGPGEWDAIEHRNSMRLTDTSPCDTEEKRLDLLRIVAHELFHTWNVRATMPQELLWCDLSREVYCPSLWIVEGCASYYQYVLLHRAGILSKSQFRRKFCDLISGFEASPGKDYMSLKDAALLPWLDRWGPEDTDRMNKTVSYYSKGAIVGLLLDFKIRGLTGGERGLDDVERALFERFRDSNRGYTEEDFIGACVDAGGESLRSFIARCVEEKSPLVYTVARDSGLAISKRLRRTYPFLGVRTDATTVVWVIPGSPAETAGIEKYDNIYAIGSKPVFNDISNVISGLRPGQRSSVSVLRNGKALRLPVIIGSHSDFYYTFEEIFTNNPEMIYAREKYYFGNRQF